MIDVHSAHDISLVFSLDLIQVIVRKYRANAISWSSLSQLA